MNALIDADVHIAAPPVETLYPYLSARWVEHFSQTLDNGASQHYYPKRAPNAGAPEAGASLERLRADVLDDTGVEAAITSCLYAVDSVHHPDVAAALASAANDWLTREWLQPEPRLRGSVVVPIQIPALAVAEIDRVAERPGFVQVLIPARTEHPLGSRLYHPVWECIERHGLVAGVHFGGSPGVPPTPTGWPSYFLEEYAAMAGVFATQLTSLIVEGVFDAFPEPARGVPGVGLYLAAGAPVAHGQGVEEPAPAGAMGETAAVRVCARARAPRHSAARRAA